MQQLEEDSPIDTAYKPHSYTSLSAYMMADDARRVIDFAKRTVDAEEVRRFDTPAGTISHAEVRIDDTVLMIADAGESAPSLFCVS